MSARHVRGWAQTGMLVAILGAGDALSQDFSAGLPAGPDPSPLALLERGLPESATALRADAASTRWFGLESFATQAATVGAGWRTLRVAAGVSRTGDRELGWNAAAVAAGGANASCGAALRALARRDLDPRGAGRAAGAGLEAGGGAWVRVAPGVRAWASAAQLWTSGMAPPMARALEVGAALERAGARCWLAHRAPHPRAFDPGGRIAGVQLAAGVGRLWLEARDRPLRGGFGCAARVRRLAMSVALEGHPVLGETVSVSLAVIALEGEP